MIDFRAQLSPEERARLDRDRRERKELRGADLAGLLAEVIHVYHNVGARIGAHPGTYADRLHEKLVPELLRRLCPASELPSKCPLCGQHVDWTPAEATAASDDLTDDERSLFARVEASEERWTSLELLRDWDAARRLCGALGRLVRNPGNVSQVGVREHCVRCGENNPDYKNGRCQNVKGSVHDWRSPRER